MCFSAEASFSASIILGAVGIITIKKTESSSQLAFAIIPILFSVQQLSEGFLWLALRHEYFLFLKPVSTYTFLIFAQIIWPTWVPLSIMLFEKEGKRKKILSYLSATGIALSLYLTYCFFFYHLDAAISDHHIKYNLGFPHIKNYLWITSTFYFTSTVISTFISSAKGMRLLGVTILISSVITHFFLFKFFISIWCFCAAIMSVLVLRIILKEKV